MVVKDKMDTNEAANYLTVLIDKILQKIQDERPDLKISITPAQRKELAKNVAQMITKNELEIDRNAAIDNNPKFLHKLTMLLVLTSTMEKHNGLRDSIKKLFNDRGVENENDINKKLTPTELKKLQMQLRKIHEELLQNMEELRLLKRPKPEAPKNKMTPAAPKPDETDQVVNNMMSLLGVDFKKPGSVPPTIFIQGENGNAIVDVSAASNESYAPIDRGNQTRGKPEGDPLSITFATIENFEALNGPKGAIDQTHSQIASSKSMQPHPPGQDTH